MINCFHCYMKHIYLILAKILVEIYIIVRQFVCSYEIPAPLKGGNNIQKYFISMISLGGGRVPYQAQLLMAHVI